MPSRFPDRHTADVDRHLSGDVAPSISAPPTISISSMLLLPYLHKADVKPAGARKARRHLLRDECYVDIRHFRRTDFVEAIVVDHDPGKVGGHLPDGRSTVILERDGRLFRALTHKGAETTVDLLAEYLKEPTVVWKGEHPYLGGSDGERGRFPVPGIRFGVSNRANPLGNWSLGGLCMSQDWMGARKEWSDEADAAGRAARHLSDALAIVDGVVHAECSEPVWHCSQWEGRTARLRPVLRPENMRAAGYFRLDQPDRARAWAAACKWRIVEGPLAPTVAIRSPTAVQREDLVELAKEGLRCWPYLRGWCAEKSLAIHGKDGHAEALDAAVAAGGVPTWRESGIILEAMTTIRRTYATGMRWGDGAYGGRPDAIEGLARRWTYERPDFDADLHDRLDDADIEALGDWRTW